MLIYLHRVLFMALARYAYSFHFTCIGHVDESCLYWFFSSQISRKTSQRVRYKAPGSHDDDIDECPDQRIALCYSHPKIRQNFVKSGFVLCCSELFVPMSGGRATSHADSWASEARPNSASMPLRNC